MDLSLIRRSQSGEEGAFEALFHAYKNLVYRTAFWMLGSRQEAEDALQEVFVQVYRSLATYDPQKGAFTTWLHRITVNHCLKRRRKRFLTVQALREVARTLLTWIGPALEEDVADATLQRGLDRLSDKLRTVVILRYYHDLSYLEIADVLNLPVGTVKSRLSLSLKALQRALRDEAAEATVTAYKEARS